MTAITRAMPRERRLGRYELLLEVGHGGMAMVYAARASGPGGFERLFAVKRVHDFLARDAEFVAMFLDEARISATLHHAHVAQVFELGEDDGRYYLAMEYLHGEPLSEVLRAASAEGRAMPVALAAWVVARAAEGLHHAHEARDPTGRSLALVHRDVSPHNIFLTYDGQVKLTDFGVAKALGRTTRTESGAVKGKLAYASPEQLRLARDLDRRSDVFALGVVLWEATTGRRLFRADNDLETMRRIEEGFRVAPSSIVPGYPPRLEAIVDRALAHDREQRTASASELARALDAFVREAAPEGVAASTLEAFLADVLGPRRAEKERALEAARAAADAAREGSPGEPSALLDVTQTRAPGTPSSAVRMPALSRRLVPVLAVALTTLALGTAVVLLSRPPPPIAPVAAAPAREQAREPDPAPAPPAAPLAVPAEPAVEPAPAPTETSSPPRRPRRTRAPAEADPPAPAERAPAPVGTGTLTLITRPWARVVVDGRELGETPLVSRRVRSGQLRVRLQREGEGPWRELTIDVAPGETVERYLDL